MTTSHAQNATPKSGHPQDQFGPALSIVKDLGVGGSMDAAVGGDRLYAIGGGKLHVADIAEPRSPKLLGELGGLGSTRQIEVANGIAYITARHDGLFIVDVSDSSKPKLLCHYNTIEFATGIAVSGQVAFVACRQNGVELIDVTDPRKPLHLSSVRTGEAQSCVVRDGILYAGVWWTKELVICDVSNPRKPTVIAKAEMDGYGDGLTVRGNYCFAATGHHPRSVRHGDESNPAYGGGHGLEIFDVSQPDQPKFVSRIKAPRCYGLSNDFWDAAVSGDYAYLGDTHNGLFIVDISDLTKPSFVGHRQLEYVEKRKACGPVGGFAVGDGVVYVAGAWTDLHVVDAAMAKPVVPDPDTPPAIPPYEPETSSKYRVYKPDGQVWAVAFDRDVALVACGAAGLHEVELWPEIKKLAEYQTEGFALDVKVRGDLVYVAEGMGGLSMWRRTPAGALECVGRFREPGQSIKQVVVPPGSPYALLDVGPNMLYIVDVSDLANPRHVFKANHVGLFYSYQITDGLFEDRYASALWGNDGFFWFDLHAKPVPVQAGDNYRAGTGFNSNMAMLPDKKHALVIVRYGYVIIDRHERRPAEELTLFRVEGHSTTGKPTICGNTLYTADRLYGHVRIVDITHIEHPKLVDSLELSGNPGLIVEHNGTPIIPAGYQGLLVLNNKPRG